ncbi:MAG: O-antigen ligase family protein [Lachnospiraceae bacterium]|nr:O-antigen ligase family protein [Lachnospiraceae bacterium]
MGTVSQKNRKKPEDYITLIPLIAVIAVVPLVFRLYRYDTGLSGYDYFAADGTADDFALHGKMVLFTILSSVMACVAVIKLVKEKKKIRFSKIFIPLGVYALLALLSSIFSKYQPFPWTGIFEQFETCFVLMGYVITAYYAFLFVNSEDDLKVLVIAFAISTCIIVFIGFCQEFFTDLLNTGFGKFFAIPQKYRSQISESGEQLYFKFKIWRVYLTMSNPNYVGSYVSLVSPVFLMLVFADKRKWMKVFYAALYIGLMICLFGSGSKTGFVGIIGTLVMLIIIFARPSKKFLMTAGIMAASILAVSVIYSLSVGNGYFKRLQESLHIEKTDNIVNGIETSKNDVRIIYRDTDLYVMFDNETVSFMCSDDAHKPLPLSFNEDQTEILIDDERYEGVSLKPVYLKEDVLGFEVYAGRSWYFANIDGEYFYYSPYGKFIRHSISKAWKWLDEHGLFATGRGYLWARTIPMLKDYIFLGSGADTFQLVYPGDDFVASYNSKNWGFIVTKPHCMYLQVAVQTGLISLIALLVFLALFVIGSIKNVRKDKERDLAYYLTGGICAGVFGYLITQVFNDSTVAIAPLFWGLIGIGLAAGRMMKQRTSSVVER